MVVFVVTINVKIAVVDNIFIIVGSVVIADVGGGDVVVSVRGDGSVFQWKPSFRNNLRACTMNLRN